MQDGDPFVQPSCIASQIGEGDHNRKINNVQMTCAIPRSNAVPWHRPLSKCYFKNEFSDGETCFGGKPLWTPARGHCLYGRLVVRIGVSAIKESMQPYSVRMYFTLHELTVTSRTQVCSHAKPFSKELCSIVISRMKESVVFQSLVRKT